MPKQHLGLGTTLGYKLTSGGSTYTQLSNRVTMDWSGHATASIPISGLDTVGGMVFRQSGLYDGGQWAITAFYDPQDTSHQAMFTNLEGGGTIYWQVTYADGSTLTFAGFLTDGGVTGIEIESVLQASWTLKVTGALAYVAGTGNI